MRTLTSIVAVNQQGAIGAGNTLPWRVKSDLRFFREQTRGNVVIMGRRTFDSLGRGLPDRANIVVTHGFGFFSASEGCRAAGSIDEALAMANQICTKRQQVFIVGGASMYEQFSPYVDRYLITVIKKNVLDADTFFSDRIIGNEDKWNKKIVLSGRADGINDEADFDIFELNNLRPDIMASRRDRVFADLEQKRRGNRFQYHLTRQQAAI